MSIYGGWGSVRVGETKHSFVPTMKTISTVLALLPFVSIALAGIPDKIYGVNLGSWYSFRSSPRRLLFNSVLGWSWNHGCCLQVCTENISIKPYFE